ncbi:MAG TPA: hypothetical protein VIV60_09225 [Polyangiaceae bacterium]
MAAPLFAGQRRESISQYQVDYYRRSVDAAVGYDGSLDRADFLFGTASPAVQGHKVPLGTSSTLPSVASGISDGTRLS